MKMISKTTLHARMPKNVRKMTDRYKQMCGCKIKVLWMRSYADLHLMSLIMTRMTTKRKNTTKTMMCLCCCLTNRDKKAVRVKTRMIKNAN